VSRQGMFDNQTSMSLTACIFGLSTLLSSLQVYNVQNRIQVGSALFRSNWCPVGIHR
jgi:hypothetical protein